MGNKWELIGRIKSSDLRLRILKKLNEGVKTPTELSKEAEISTSHVSEMVVGLANMKLIECLNPNLRKGKIYSITKLGKEILEQLV